MLTLQQKKTLKKWREIAKEILWCSWLKAQNIAFQYAMYLEELPNNSECYTFEQYVKKIYS